MHLNLGSKQRYFIFGMVSVSLLAASISTSSAAVALSPIMVDLKTSLILAGWVITSYQLFYAAIQPLAGKISDVLGRKSTLLFCTALFTAGSVLSALAPGIYALIAARVLQAVGGGGFQPSAAGIVADAFPKSRPRVIGLFTTILSIGTFIGPTVGGWLTQSFGWRAIFLFSVPFGVVVLISAWLLMPTDQKKTGVSIDYAGSGLLLGVLFAFLVGITQLGRMSNGVSWIGIIALFVVSGVLLVVFLRHEKRTKQPIIDVELLKERPFLAANGYNLLYGAISVGLSSIIPLYAVKVYGMSTLESGLITTPRTIALIVTSTITSIYIMKWGYRKPILIGTLVVVMALFFLATEPRGMRIGGLELTHVPLLVIFVGLAGIGSGLAGPAASNACIELMPDKVASIVGLRGVFRTLGQALCVTVTTVILSIKGDMYSGFTLVFILIAAVTLAFIPTIFIMPGSPEVKAKAAVRH